MNWELIDERGGYWFWKYTDSDGEYIYNCTQSGKPPINEAGYYSYGYLLKVKGLMKGVTLDSIMKELKP